MYSQVGRSPMLDIPQFLGLIRRPGRCGRIRFDAPGQCGRGIRDSWLSMATNEFGTTGYVLAYKMHFFIREGSLQCGAMA
jgi:hypothetical protein